jgi:hypothetical protein
MAHWQAQFGERETWTDAKKPDQKSKPKALLRSPPIYHFAAIVGRMFQTMIAVRGKPSYFCGVALSMRCPDQPNPSGSISSGNH